MGDQNNNQRDAFTEKIKNYIEFASIIQNYDATSHVAHDDIDFEHDPDGAEYDSDGEPVTLYGVTIYNFTTSVEYDDGWQDYPEDHASLGWDDDDRDENYDHPAYRFPLYDPRKPPCNHRSGSFYWIRNLGTPPT